MSPFRFNLFNLFRPNYWILRRYTPLVNQIMEQFGRLQTQSRATLIAKANQLRQEIELLPANKRNQKTFLIRAFALASAAINEILQIKLHRVQIYGALALHYGNVAEMKTGEGKTLTALLPAYFNCLLQQRTYIVTVNEYLVKRDATENEPIFKLLGVKTGYVLASMEREGKTLAYQNDVIYITNSEIGFDYLRDNMRSVLYNKLQRSLDFVIVDEVDSILIDEGRTPLIISGKPLSRAQNYLKVNQFIKRLKPSDYRIERETKQVFLVSSGVLKAQAFFATANLFALENAELVHFINNGLYAHTMLTKNVDYIVKNNQILLIDHFTGRILEGRNLSEGLHQSLEAKEGVPVKNETTILASITYQNLFRLFKKIAGMTGTAKSEADEFREIYNMEVVQIPTNRLVIRHDDNDKIFYNDTHKYTALIEEIKRRHQQNQPILIGTNALQVSEIIAAFLTRAKLPFRLLNAKHHEYEARIIAQAGKAKAITIATNMAGRGTDIKLDTAAKQAGGLAVLGVARNDSRRIDLQLRGRSGRQGEPGYSCFFLSLDDVLFRRFGSRTLKTVFARVQDQILQSRLLNRTIKRAQHRLTNLSYEQRKNILEYDNIISQQREIVYLKRESLFRLTTFAEYWTRLIDRYLEHQFQLFSLEHFHFSQTNVAKFHQQLLSKEVVKVDDISPAVLTTCQNWESVLNQFKKCLKAIFLDLDSDQITFFTVPAKMLVVRILDDLWSNYLSETNKLKSSIYLQSYAQKQPLQLFIEQTQQMYQDLKHKLQERSILEVRRIINNYLN